MDEIGERKKQVEHEDMGEPKRYIGLEERGEPEENWEKKG